MLPPMGFMLPVFLKKTNVDENPMKNMEIELFGIKF
jgi:hypothetical protein